MMCMCLVKTGNLHLVEPWIMGLHKVFDHNNSGVAEADNPGQLLYMISLVSDRNHPLVPKILQAVESFRKGDHVLGKSDYADHPVYQTKWLKYGLRSLGLDDPYRIPLVPDSYSSLFWMDWRDQHVDHPRFSQEHAAFYPYLHWAEVHFYNDPPPVPVEEDRYPVSWEARASEAGYWRMRIVSEQYVSQRIAAPHTWHAAEMFLYFLDRVLQ